MKYIISIFIVFMPFLTHAEDFDFSTFIKRCGWGSVIGAAAGTITLAFEDHPFDHLNNISRGASLGLYGGIIYGLTVPVSQEKFHRFDTTPVDPVRDETQLFFNHDFEKHKTDLLFVKRF